MTNTKDADQDLRHLTPPESDPTAAAGWYPDPLGAGSFRRWNGHSWTQDRLGIGVHDTSGEENSLELTGTRPTPKPSSGARDRRTRRSWTLRLRPETR